ncbi:hypothetical protein COCSUDRAFT_45766 [Coccomyxa subellipsoidea C-169]|uniref:Patatin n=1 Tax=Coccomyxa subellipsoidea (strain C-169) TaxID=574566 RepID=I0Z965_COCSC|nr:hypothetical protein COCSUDRAFT_45766 [Coccomyxa subellipsoidea C-169]EIE27184.1 hypothetical protein COCSUDRAFT_45766 [Coccomyxa subellipsoidea C-169]|eukprot:XP_005651728.1 hypothetical protein COCSUDRAFT_45766 [Coccomyxa subellipsoidea C-169]
MPILVGWPKGAVKYLQQRFDIERWQMRGASAGALVATLAACNVNSEVAFESAHRLSVENKLFERPLGLAGVWGSIVRQWLEDILPANAADKCRGRLKLVVTDIRGFQLAYIDDFATKDEVIDANLASAHIPFFLDGRPFASFRNKLYIDGSVTDFLYYDNSELLKCNGDAFILDYTQDELLSTTRLDFVKLRNPEEIKHLIDAGYAYAQRMDDTGVLMQYFGGAGSLQSPNVWEDVRKEQEAVVTFSADGKERLGPLGTTSRAVLDEDIPAGGAFYCTPCSRYFLSDHALSEHSRTKPHKRRLKELGGARPHNQRDAELAAGMGAPDNGQKAKPVEMES